MHPRRRELDGERDAVETTADLDDCGDIRRGQRERRLRRARAVHEKANRIDGSEVLPRSCPLLVLIVGANRARHGQRGHLEDPLTIHPERLAACGQHGQGGTAGEERDDEVGGRSDDVLAVVKEQEQRLGAEEVDERVESWPAGLVGHAKHTGGLPRNKIGAGDRRQLNQPGSVPSVAKHVGRHLAHEPRLAGTADTDQGHQPVGVQQLRELRRAQARVRRTR